MKDKRIATKRMVTSLRNRSPSRLLLVHSVGECKCRRLVGSWIRRTSSSMDVMNLDVKVVEGGNSLKDAVVSHGNFAKNISIHSENIDFWHVLRFHPHSKSKRHLNLKTTNPL